MNFQWSSLEQIRNAFGLPEGSDGRQVRRLLRARLKTLHPDSTDGAFGSDAAATEFHRIQAAVDFLDLQMTAGPPAVTRETMLAMTDMTEAIAAILRQGREPDRQAEQARRLEERQKRVNEQIEGDVRRRYRFFKLAAGAVAGFFGFLSLFPDKFTTHPVFVVVNKFTQSLDMTVGLALLYLMLLGAGAVVYFWWEEQRELNFKKRFLGDAGIEQVIRSRPFVARLGPMGAFTRADLLRVLAAHKVSKDHNILTEIADLMLEKLLARGAARKVPKPSLSDSYELDYGLYMELRPPQR